MYMVFKEGGLVVERVYNVAKVIKYKVSRKMKYKGGSLLGG